MNMKKLLCRGAYYCGMLMMCSSFALVVIDVIDGRSQIWITCHIAAEILSAILMLGGLLAEPLADHEDAIRELQDFKQALLNNARPEPQAAHHRDSANEPTSARNQSVEDLEISLGGPINENGNR